MVKTVTYYSLCDNGSGCLDRSISEIVKQAGLNLVIKDVRLCSQVDFMLDVHRDLAVIVDATIPEDMSKATVYPIFTAHINILNHIIVFSQKTDEDGNEILPLNIVPQRKRTNKDSDIAIWIREQLSEIASHNGYYMRLNVETLDDLLHYQSDMEKMMVASLNLPNSKTQRKKTVMISYRNKYASEVTALKERKEKEGDIEVKALPPGSLCGDYEAHTPMRRWMLVGLLEDHIRTVDEVWVYLTDDYTDSWWTLAEMVMTANLNYDRPEKKIKICVFDPSKGKFLPENEVPSYLIPNITQEQHQRLARYLSNTRPDTMGPEMLQQVSQMKQLAQVLRTSPDFIKKQILANLKETLSASIPSELPDDQKEEMLSGLLSLYSNPDELEKYASDDVFQDLFWKNILYQVGQKTSAFIGNRIDVDAFMQVPMLELTNLNDSMLSEICTNDGTAELSDSEANEKYKVSVGMTRYLWLATRMGQPTVKNAPGLEVFQAYNLIKE